MEIDASTRSRLRGALAAAATLAAACWAGPGADERPARPLTAAERTRRGQEIVEELGGRCEAGEEAACWRLSTWLTHGTFERNFVIPPDPARGLPFTERSCEHGTAGSCIVLGRAYTAGRGAARDDVKALRAFRRACDAPAGEAGCASLGRLVEAGRGTPPDPAAAAAHYRAACTGREKSGCAPLGSLYRRGAGLPRDYERARKLYSRVCADFPHTADDAAGCAGLGVIYERGLGVPSDLGKAHRYYARACDAARDRSACTAMDRVQELAGY